MHLPKITDGPWYVGSMNDCLFIIDQPPRPSTDYVVETSQVNVIAKLDYKGADDAAALIAASPELLKLARDYRGVIEFNIRRDLKDGDDEGATLKRFTLAYVNGVIAKAEGRS